MTTTGGVSPGVVVLVLAFFAGLLWLRLKTLDVTRSRVLSGSELLFRRGLGIVTFLLVLVGVAGLIIMR